MADILTTLKTRINQHVRYQRTVHEIQSLPLNVALDLNIYQGDAKKIARRAVYGN